MSEIDQGLEHLVKANEITLDPEYEGKDICKGADPYIIDQDGLWHLLLQDDLRSDPRSHDGLLTYTIRSADTIAGLSQAEREQLIVGEQTENLKQVWAGEIFGNHLYVATSDGKNENHRMRIYETEGNVAGPWIDKGLLKAPLEDDSWAIDLTIAEIPFGDEKKKYGVWSGWENPDDQFPQNLYIAEMITPYEIGKRHLLARPEGKWSTSERPLLEGPQSLALDGDFKGLLVTGNASWTPHYATGILKYNGGNPLEMESWKMSENQLFPAGKGIGHGVVVEEKGELYYVGHRKTSKVPGWEDRTVFYTKLNRDALESFLKEI